MSGLNGNQSAEPVAKHKNRPDPQRTTRHEENDAKPANDVPLEDPDLVPVRVGRQPRVPTIVTNANFGDTVMFF
jgi:hypothetical protein